MKKVIVTGHNGFIGPHMVRLLKESGYYVKGIDTNYFDDSCKFSDYIKPDEELIRDIREIKRSDLEGVYAVCHLAGLSNDPMGDLNKSLTYDINHKASVRLAKLSKQVGIEKYIFMASCSMYGIADGDIALDESAAFAPETAYAESKVNTEKDVKPMGDENFSVTDTLTVPLKEARESFEKQYLISQLKKFSGNISQTAKFIGMERSALHRKLKLLGVKDLN